MLPRLARIRVTALIATAFVGSMLVTVSYAPALYRAFCDATGIDGTPKRAGDVLKPSADGHQARRKLTVFFDTNVAPGLDWDFKPEQRSVEVEVGIPATVYFDARNKSAQTQVARAVYNVTPSGVAPYFYKIQCFCFTSEKLAPGESAQMPVVFYLDDAMLADENVQKINDVTLSYTFYNQKGLPADDVAAARDLKAGSAAEAKQKLTADTSFVNDAVRREEP
ncbi:cytochrome c oxidase assembly protein [Labrys monachus]|uniref:Cytochrome c oxidase assembly protein CtaG n=1 Tax=Labrys monachus TaxID=217067 RepID=A0ABU0FCY3_9HYPH|nr:cytochrome c oxidase assembly protein [Labrys monachus]MDQ0392467.1 cytochrome c oxidase assembly protein subunit 11 [Labrys monachus]